MPITMMKQINCGKGLGLGFEWRMMTIDVAYLFSVWVKFFFLFTPFFALSMFLGMTRGYEAGQRTRLALQVGGAVAVLCLILFFFGNQVFDLFGITLDAFRVGAGGLLFLSAVSLIHGPSTPPDRDPDEDIAVVPLAMPIIVGPATVGALMVMGAEITDTSRKLQGCLALMLAILTISLLLVLGALLERIVGKRGILILSRVTALVLAALAAQMILTGVRHFWLVGEGV